MCYCSVESAWHNACIRDGHPCHITDVTLNTEILPLWCRKYDPSFSAGCWDRHQELIHLHGNLIRLMYMVQVYFPCSLHILRQVCSIDCEMIAEMYTNFSTKEQQNMWRCSFLALHYWQSVKLGISMGSIHVSELDRWRGKISIRVTLCTLGSLKISATSGKWWITWIYNDHKILLTSQQACFLLVYHQHQQHRQHQ